MTREEVLKKNQAMLVLFDAWMTEIKKQEIVTYRQKNGDLIRHYPNGTTQVIDSAKR